MRSSPDACQAQKSPTTHLGVEKLAAMYLLGFTITTAVVVSTWIAVGQKALHYWDDSSIWMSPKAPLQEWDYTSFNETNPPHPENCTTCLFATGTDDSPVMVGLKVPQIQYSQFKLLLLSPNSHAVISDISSTEQGLARFLRHPRMVQAIGFGEVVAVILGFWLQYSFYQRHSVKSRNITNANEQELRIFGCNLTEWLPGSVFQSWQRPALEREQHSDTTLPIRDLQTAEDNSVGPEHSATLGDTPSKSEGGDLEDLKADPDQHTVRLDSEIERSLTDIAEAQKEVDLIKDNESLRKKLAFTTSKLREKQKEIEELRARNALQQESY